MARLISTTFDDLHTSIAEGGFTFVEGVAMRTMLESAGSLSDWHAFARSWDTLELDTYMADGGRYRRRRYAMYAAPRGSAIVRKPHGPHYQSLNYNPLHGGIERWFEPIEDNVSDGASLSTILRFCQAAFNGLATHVGEWHVEVHQFRIEARPSEMGRPTPEGLHRDGVDYVLVLLIERENIASGMTTIHDLTGQTLGQFTLTNPFDAAIVDDQRVAHGVTPVQALDASKPAHRDVLVVTFRDVASLPPRAT